MSKQTGRYVLTECDEIGEGDERIRYLRRRFIPHGNHVIGPVRVTVREGERVDQVAARALGNASRWWVICDANDAMSPFDLLDEPGTALAIPTPGLTVT